MTKARLAIMAVALMGAGPAMAATAPHLAESSFGQLAQPLPKPYDEAGDATRDVDAAMARAKAAHKLLIVDMGGNWCPDCRILAGTLALPDLAPWVHKHFEVVTVDVGRFTKNMDIATRFGAPAPKGVPAVLVIDPRSGKLLDEGHTIALSDARSMSPQALADWLAQWVKG